MNSELIKEKFFNLSEEKQNKLIELAKELEFDKELDAAALSTVSGGTVTDTDPISGPVKELINDFGFVMALAMGTSVLAESGTCPYCKAFIAEPPMDNEAAGRHIYIHLQKTGSAD